MRTKRKTEKAYENVLKQYGKYLVYIRRDTRIRCSCWSDNSREGDPRHPTCLGTGYKITIERYLGLVQVSMPNTQQEYASAHTPIGVLTQSGTILFFPRETWPNTGDKVIEVEWDVSKSQVLNRGRVARLLDSYALQNIDRISSVDGEIIAHKCATHSEDMQYTWLEDQLKSKDFTWDPANEDGILYSLSSYPFAWSYPPSSGLSDGPQPYVSPDVDYEVISIDGQDPTELQLIIPDTPTIDLNTSTLVTKYIVSSEQGEGDVHLSSSSNWGISKALIKLIRVSTSSTDWDLWILRNDNGHSANDASIPELKIAENEDGNRPIYLDLPYIDEDNSAEVHLYFVDNAGSNTATFYILGYEMR
jgi:hypothetical protein